MYLIGFAIAALSLAATLALRGASGTGELAFAGALAAFVIVAHVPVLLPRGLRRKLLKPADIEAPGKVSLTALALLASGWGCVVAFAPGEEQAVLTVAGALVIAAMAALYFAAGMAVPWTSIKPVSTYPLPVKSGAAAFAGDVCYGVRAALGVLSMVASLLLAAGSSAATLPWTVAAASVLAISSAAALLFNLQWLAGSTAALRSAEQSHILSTLARRNPEFVIYYSAAAPLHADRIDSAVEMLASIERPYVIVVRERACFDALDKKRLDHIILVDRIEKLDQYILPSLKAALYVTDAEKNAQFTRFTGLAHIYLYPGVKPPRGPLPQTLAIYSHIVVKGEALAEEIVKCAPLRLKSRISFYGARSQVQPMPSVRPLDGTTVIGWLLAPPEQASRDWSLVHPTAAALLARIKRQRDTATAALHNGAPPEAKTQPYSVRLKAGAALPGDSVRTGVLSALRAQIKDYASSSEWGSFSEFTGDERALAAMSDVLLADCACPIEPLRECGKPVVLTDMLGIAGSDESSAAFPDCYLVSPDLSNLDAVLALAAGSDPKRDLRQKLRNGASAALRPAAGLLSRPTLGALVGALARADAHDGGTPAPEAAIEMAPKRAKSSARGLEGAAI